MANGEEIPFGQMLAVLRLARKLTASTAGKLVDRSQTHLSSIESGVIASVRIPMTLVHALASVYDVNKDRLYLLSRAGLVRSCDIDALGPRAQEAFGRPSTVREPSDAGEAVSASAAVVFDACRGEDKLGHQRNGQGEVNEKGIRSLWAYHQLLTNSQALAALAAFSGPCAERKRGEVVAMVITLAAGCDTVLTETEGLAFLSRAICYHAPQMAPGTRRDLA
jgi:transcriptional regulator with XRE-family HTH domain